MNPIYGLGFLAGAVFCSSRKEIYSFLTFQRASATSFIVGRSSFVGAVHWNASSEILVATLQDALDLSSFGSSISIIFPLKNFLNAWMKIAGFKYCSMYTCMDIAFISLFQLQLEYGNVLHVYFIYEIYNMEYSSNSKVSNSHT